MGWRCVGDCAQAGIELAKLDAKEVALQVEPFSPAELLQDIAQKLQLNDDAVTIGVADTGVGIPSEEIPHVFERFYRITNGDRGSEEHAGLGLAITKSILDLHDARMKVDSKVGVGTTFSFVLSEATLNKG